MNMKRQSKSSQQGWDASTGLGTLPQVSVGAAPGEGSGSLEGTRFSNSAVCFRRAGCSLATDLERKRSTVLRKD